VTEYVNAPPYGDKSPGFRALGASAQLNNPEGLDVDAVDDLYVANEFGGVNEYLPGMISPFAPALRRRLTLTVRRAPTVTAITPARGHGRGGTPVTLAGTGFATARGHTIVRFGRLTALRVRCRSHTTCTARAPAHESGRVTVTVTVAGLTSTTRPAIRFSYIR
jgi:hypothetical protein